MTSTATKADWQCEFRGAKGICKHTEQAGDTERLIGCVHNTLCVPGKAAGVAKTKGSITLPATDVLLSMQSQHMQC